MNNKALIGAEVDSLIAKYLGKGAKLSNARTERKMNAYVQRNIGTKSIAVQNRVSSILEIMGLSSHESDSKMIVSKAWTPKERVLLMGLIRKKMLAIDAQEAELRKTILYEAPCFRTMQQNKGRLMDLINMLSNTGEEFLEINRYNFSEFLN